MIERNSVIVLSWCICSAFVVFVMGSELFISNSVSGRGVATMKHNGFVTKLYLNSYKCPCHP